MAEDIRRDEANEYDARLASSLEAVRGKLERMATWTLRDIDPVTTRIAFVFYLRSVGAHRFRNALDEVVTDTFDSISILPADFLMRSPDRAAEYILTQAKEGLKRAKSCV